MDNSYKARHSGSILIVVIAETIVLIGVIIFGLVSFSNEQKYKNDDNQLIAQAVSAATQKTQTTDAANFFQKEKQPLVTYTGPEALGTVVLNYPKTWSAYIDDSGSGAALIDGYFAPGVVPPINSQTSVYSLRLQVIQQSYDTSVGNLSGQVKAGTTTMAAYSLPKLPNVVGVQVKGILPDQKTGEMVILPLRDKTIEVWTEAPQYESDFTTYILPNFSFSP